MRDQAPVEIDWQEANQRHLSAELARIRRLLQRAAGNPKEGPRSQTTSPHGAPQSETALGRLVELFQLTPFEKDLILLCAGMELEGDFSSLAAQAQKDDSRSHPTFSLALAALENPHWSAMLTSRPLRRWRLIEIGSGGGLTTSPLRIDERVLHYLTGLDDRDERLAGLVEPTPQTVELPPSHQSIAENLAGAWSTGETPPPALQLCGPDSAGKRDIAAAASARLGRRLWSISARALPSAADELDLLMRIWERQALLSPCVLLLDCEDLEGNDASGNIVDRFIEGCASPLIVATRQRRRMRYRPMLTFEVGKPKPGEQREFWSRLLGRQAKPMQQSIDQFVAQFNLSSSEIYAACLGGFGRLSSDAPRKKIAKLLGTHIWDTCRLQARPRLDDLAQRIEPGPDWDDLVLPDAQSRTLGDIAAQVAGRSTVYERWGFARKSHRGLGISALFAGASGTGKTMAAEVLARELELDLYRIDLSSVISKYIGETEKNLRRVFDAAEEGGVVLLFDEADALFGKRSEVKDSHDRHANVEISYLLQRMEAYRGLAILTSNLKEALDTAFLRRIRFIVHFPFPNAAARARIWRRVFPEETPTQQLDFDRLAQLNVSGGAIRNIAMNAAFSAAHRGSPVGMKDLLRAARAEFDKLEKPLPGSEVEGWA